MKRLKELRMKKGLNMQQTATALELPYTTYVNYEKGIREPNSETLIRLATFFNVSIDYLIGRTSDPDIIPEIPFSWNNIVGATITLSELVASEVLYQDEADLLLDYRQLNRYGQQKAREYTSDLVDNVKYAIPDGYLCVDDKKKKD